MNRTVFSNVLRFVVLLFVQVFLLKNLGYYNLATPFLYILFVLALPFNTPNWLLFLLAFVSGTTIDAFYDTAGVNAAAMTMLALVRIIFINLTVQRDGFDNEPEPRLGIMGFRWFFFYTAVLTLFHHTTLFLLETFHFEELNYTMLRILFSSCLTIVLVLISELIFSPRKGR